jgi:hypothetical protein
VYPSQAREGQSSIEYRDQVSDTELPKSGIQDRSGIEHPASNKHSVFSIDFRRSNPLWEEGLFEIVHGLAGKANPDLPPNFCEKKGLLWNRL